MSLFIAIFVPHNAFYFYFNSARAIRSQLVNLIPIMVYCMQVVLLSFSDGLNNRVSSNREMFLCILKPMHSRLTWLTLRPEMSMLKHLLGMNLDSWRKVSMIMVGGLSIGCLFGKKILVRKFRGFIPDEKISSSIEIIVFLRREDMNHMNIVTNFVSINSIFSSSFAIASYVYWQ